MEVVILIVLTVIALYVFAISRGKKAVRAYIYLSARNDGASEFQANDIASRIDTYQASLLNEGMLLFVENYYSGQQLAMISSARLYGFTG